MRSSGSLGRDVFFRREEERVFETMKMMNSDREKLSGARGNFKTFNTKYYIICMVIQ